MQGPDRYIAGAAAAFALLAFTAGPALAQGRIDARRLSCGEARAIVAQNGAVVFTTGRYTYDRYVAGERFCPIGHIVEDAWIPTTDTESCNVGYKCVLKPWDDEPRWRMHR
ncbi:hypothetical protein [Chelativorans sp. AA-79]|uniref:hypothetical protein n=1 Tax=Chelativorans sp. AA-79 TaxID=3028735 RepID=UPI0023F839D3|nr:hypothetical protein [Chelativorans sp. AA-79]WEX11416.1 hypothetical protein PVE73_11030 [Chelativorans sp. AA-79]